MDLDINYLRNIKLLQSVVSVYILVENMSKNVLCTLEV
jgi:hypothetical protein